MNEGSRKDQIKAYKGIKGSSVLESCTFYSPWSSSQIDVMHTVGLGVIKNLFEYWFEFKLGNYSLRDFYDEIEKRYLTIKPPDYLASAPKSITEWKNWKAREFINFILFYSLPIFINLMPVAHYEHLTKFVIALEILLSQNINRNSIAAADELLNGFVKDASGLYTPNIMKSGMHELLHLATCTIQIGPLNALSCFPFEELNRCLIRLIKGRDLMGEEFYKLFIIHQSLNIFAKRYRFNNEELKRYIQNNTRDCTSNRKDRCNSEENFKVSYKVSISKKSSSLIKFAHGNNLRDFHFFERIKFKGTTYTSYSDNQKFNNSCIKFEEATGIIEVIYVEDNNPFAICRRVSNLNNFFFDSKYPNYRVSCFYSDIADDEYFIAPIKEIKKVFLIQINENLTFVNYFKSTHLFT